MPDFQSQLLSDRLFIEPACMMNGINEGTFKLYALEFFTTKKALEQDKWKDYLDCKRNFMFWLPSAIQRKKNGIFNDSKIGIQTYNLPTMKSQEPEDLDAVDEKNAKADANILKMVEDDVELYRKNENYGLKIPQKKMDLLLQHRLTSLTKEQVEDYMHQARDKRILELNAAYDPVTRIKLRHYENGGTPEQDLPILKSMAREIAYRDYLKSRVAVFSTHPVLSSDEINDSLPTNEKMGSHE